jgi:iron complex transport system substrate-binding protein
VIRSGQTRRALLAATGAAAVLSAPCAARAARVFVDDTGRRIALPARVDRVFAAGPPASVAVFALASGKLLGWPRALRGEEARFMAPVAATLPETGRLTGRGDTTNLEVLLSLRPDLIVDVGTVSRTTIDLADRIQQRTGIPYVLLDGTFPRTASMLRRLGGALVEDESGDRLARLSARIVERLAAHASATPPAARPRVYYGRGPQGLETGGPGSINVEILEFAGLANVAAGPASLFTVSPEQLLVWNPDTLILLDAPLARAVVADARWRGIEAIARRRVFVPPRLPFGWIDFPPGINRLAGLLWIEHVVLGLTDGAQYREELREVLRALYHIEPDPPLLERLLAGG